MVIDVGADGFPTGDQISFGGQRLESGLIHCYKQRGASALPFAKGTKVQFFEQLSDGLVQFRQREEPVVPQGCQDPALHQEDCIFDLGFVESHQMQVVWGTRRGGSE